MKCNYIIVNQLSYNLTECKNHAVWAVSLDNDETHIYLCKQCFKLLKNKIPLNKLTYHKLNYEENKWNREYQNSAVYP